MGDVGPALGEIVDQLRAAGLHASVDPRDVETPGVIVRGEALEPGRGKLCGLDVLRYSLVLVMPDIADQGVYAGLDKLRATVLDTITLNASEDQPFERVILPSAPTALPCQRLTGRTILT